MLVKKLLRFYRDLAGRSGFHCAVGKQTAQNISSISLTQGGQMSVRTRQVRSEQLWYSFVG